MKNLILISLILALLGVSCRKELLNDKPDNSLLIPETLDDLRALMDNVVLMNSNPGLTNVAADDFYTTDNGLRALTLTERNTYCWNKSIFEGGIPTDWRNMYQQMFYANVVLDALAKLPRTDSNGQNWDRCRGSALFYRGFSAYYLAQSFAAPYSSSGAGNTPGIPVRLQSDVNIISQRKTLKATYDQLISDLLEAGTLLADAESIKSRPSRAATWGLLAKVYLSMSEYTKAQYYASLALQLNGNLINYNTLSATAARPMPPPLTTGNAEVIYYGILLANGFHRSALTFVNPDLYNKYEPGDLRKDLFFIKSGEGYNFRGTYTGNVSTFNGIATDELYLIRAECYARLNDVPAALADLNKLLAARFKTGTFREWADNDPARVLEKVLLERRKELVGRGVRWTDLRRLNQEVRFATMLIHLAEGQTYSLLPGSLRYTFPIPDDEIAMSGLEQNPR